MAALTQQYDGAIRFSGVGGERMAAQGLEPIFPMRDLSVMGFAEVLPRIPNLWKRIRQTADFVRTTRPDAFVTIDAPGFSFRVVKRLQGCGVPLIHYVTPQVWAWLPGRAKGMAGSVDQMLALLPFEASFFEGYGVNCAFVGHPVVENGAPDQAAGSGLRRSLGIADDDELLLLLPGSRHGEVARLLPVFAGVLEGLVKSRPNLRALLVSPPAIVGDVRKLIADWRDQPVIVDDPGQRLAAFAASDVALAASGTITLELALAKVPTVIAYRTGMLTAAIMRRLLTVPYIALPNILAEAEVMPEFLQEKCEPEGILAALSDLLDNGEQRRRQRDQLAQIGRQLGAGGAAPSTRAAEVVLRVIRSPLRQKKDPRVAGPQ